MKKVTLCCFIVVFAFALPNMLHSQILKRDISSANVALLEELRIQELERVERVESFLAINPSAKASLSTEDKIVYIYDIIDGKPIYRATDNLGAARATKTTHLQPGGSLNLNLDGSGMTVGVWDGGPAQAAHTEFSNTSQTGSRIAVIDNAVVDDDVTFSSHATHVSGTIGARGANPEAKGMAPNVHIKSYNWTNDETEMIAAANAAVDPIIISNHSYGVYVQGQNGLLDSWIMGAYTQDARDVDNIAKNNPKYLIVTSAGNSGTVSYPNGMYPGFDKLTMNANSKNNLVVANANPVLAPFTNELQSLLINTGSSQGPTDDLRIKPDIAADGTNLLSPVPVDGYAIYSGTSMASPNTAGSLVLLQEYYNQLHGEYMNSSTLKALIIHSAVDDIMKPGPDPNFGWGFLDAKASAEIITADVNADALIDELTLDNGQTYTFTFSAQAGEKLVATICWTDMPGQVIANGSLNDPSPRLINDLDLRISYDTNTYLPWKLNYSASSGFSNSKADNAVDNVEKIEIDTPVAGVYTLTVTHKGILKGNVGGPFSPQSQDFSLILTGSNLTLSTNDFDFEDVAIWPNPANDNLNINFKVISPNTNIALYDIQGRVVYQALVNENNSQRYVIDTSKFSAGVYMLKINNNTQSTSKKIIIE